jgi:hypothetical protein
MTGNHKAGIVLQPRDHRLLEAVGQMRLIDREMSKVILKLAATRNTNKRLLELTRAGLLQQYFVGTVGGGRKAIYALSEKAAALTNSEFRPLKRRAGENLVGDLFVHHQLQVNAIFLLVRFQEIPVAGVQCLRWLSFQERPFRNAAVIPDGYFELASSSGIRAMFLEVDRGTETLGIWQKKIRQYLQLAVSGEFPQKFQQQQFRVLVLTNSERRLRNIRALIAKATDKVFWLSTFELLHREGFWSPVWFRPAGDQCRSLL